MTSAYLITPVSGDAAVRMQARGRMRSTACFLAMRAQDAIAVFAAPQRERRVRTGVAPYRGFLQARAGDKERGHKLGPAMLFHGCRNRARDHLYAEEFAAMARAGVVELEPAYSRPETGAKCYVQDRVSERRDRVWELIEQGAVVYVCGDAATMAPAVEQTMLAICRDKRVCSDDAAKTWLVSMKSEGRYLVDIWPKG